MNLRIATLLIAWTPPALFAVGCGSGDEELRTFTEADNVENTDPPDVHHHAAHGPNGGHLVELGGEDYHAEVVFDHDARELAVYLLGSDAATAMPVATETVTLNLQLDGAPATVELVSAPLDGEAEGSSRFTASGESIPEALHDEEDLQGSVVVMIDGTQYRGEITHDHDHGHAHGDDHAHE